MIVANDGLRQGKPLAVVCRASVIAGDTAFGLIASDFLYLDGLRHRGPTMAFLRCDRGSQPADHHTLAMHLGPRHGYVHSAYQVADLDALAAGGQYLGEHGYRRAWGIGRHIQAARSSTTGVIPTA